MPVMSVTSIFKPCVLLKMSTLINFSGINTHTNHYYMSNPQANSKKTRNEKLLTIPVKAGRARHMQMRQKMSRLDSK